MSEWRPEDWENPYPSTCSYIRDGDSWDEPHPMYVLWEEAADAIVAALREQDIREFETLVGGVDGNPSGTLVFIPDKE